MYSNSLTVGELLQFTTGTPDAFTKHYCYSVCVCVSPYVQIYACACIVAIVLTTILMFWQGVKLCCKLDHMGRGERLLADSSTDNRVNRSLPALALF